VEFGEPGLELLPEEAISTSTRTLLASLWVADPGGGGPWEWRTLGTADRYRLYVTCTFMYVKVLQYGIPFKVT